MTVNTKPVMGTSVFNELSYQDDVARLSLDIESTQIKTDIKLWNFNMEKSCYFLFG